MGKISIVYDTETTGFSPDTDEITQLAAEKTCLDKNGNVVVLGNFNRFLRVSKKVPEQVSKLTGITNEKLDEEGISLEQAMKEFKDFVGVDSILVAHNGKRFDSRFMKRAMLQAGLEYDYQELDTLLLAQMIWPERKALKLKYSLGVLVDDFGLAKAEAHRADNDVTMLVSLLYYERQKLLEVKDEILRQAMLSNSIFHN